MTFQDLKLQIELISGLEKENITEPLPIQIKAIEPIQKGKDVYICSPTGSGKTLAYLLPLFMKINHSTPDLQVMILAPTHELASQVQDQARLLIQNSNYPIQTLLLIGGASSKRQIEKLKKKKPHIVIGSAGRILELIKTRKLKIHTLKSLVIDEADYMLSGDTLKEIKNILNTLSRDKQMIFVSATEKEDTSKEALSLAPNMEKAFYNSDEINKDIEHIYFTAHDNEKPDILRKIIRAYNAKRAIVFVHKNETAKRVSQKLEEHGIKTAVIHKDCDKLDRVKALREIRSNAIQVLVSSDVAARGIDIKGVTHVFNLDVPSQSKQYLHRAGRTGRAGAKGICVSLMTPQETKIARKYMRELNIKITPAEISKGVITDKID